MAVTMETVVEEAVNTAMEAVVVMEVMVEDVSVDTMVVVGGGGYSSGGDGGGYSGGGYSGGSGGYCSGSSGGYGGDGGRCECGYNGGGWWRWLLEWRRWWWIRWR
ncbi:PREDICTED: bacteriocin microcin B17-like [Brassica oleracea var. oleracea]|uniref:bacteriocin microcin B17-like n=1 Tax=Brassica oleracea var. oleracea TaxID=109376 RepID=UPI0006A74501|nr:PREDICTED: bacteriocin microcin B17-like [Brassica oleracea var. oleracea]